MSVPRTEPLADSDFFAGRDDELTALRNLLTRLAAGTGSAVLIEGEQGIGKSALLRRVLGGAAGKSGGAGFRLAWGTSDELGQRIPLRLIRECLGDVRLVRPGAVAAVVDPAAHVDERAVDGLLPSGDPVLAETERLLAEVERLCAESPVVLVTEERKKRDQEEDEQRRLGQPSQEPEKAGPEDEAKSAAFALAQDEPLPHSEEERVDSAHGSVHSLDADLLLPSGDPFSKPEGSDVFKDGLRRAQSTDSLGTSGSLQAKALGYNNKAKSAGNLDESDFGPLVGADSASENFDTASLGSLQMPSGFMLTKDQEKAIKAMTPEQEETASLLSSVTQGVESAYVSPSGYRLVSETEWNLLQKEVQNAGNKLGRRCDMCSNYEKQLQGIQTQEAETRDQVKKLQAMLRQANDQLEKMAKDKQGLEELMRQSSEESGRQISALALRTHESELLLVELQQAFSQAQRNTQEQMGVLTQSREQVSEELTRLQKENESLQGKRGLHLALQQAEDFVLPESVEELRELVLKYRESMVSVRTAADHGEEKLKAEILFLRDQIQAEQCLKENLEETLQLEIETCKEEIASISSLKAELERTRADREQLESTLRERTEQLESLREIEIALGEQLKRETLAKTTVEQLMFEEKNKAQRLQTELDVSEQVQRDFVKLSQTLQVQLERIRQADSLERVRAILNDTKLTDINQLPET